MLIAIDGIPLLTPKSGIGKYTLELSLALKRLPQAPKVRFSYGVHWIGRLKKKDISVPDVGYNTGVEYRKRFEWIPAGLKEWLKGALYRTEIALIRPDIFHATNYVASSFKTPTVITVCDLTFMRYPETLPPERLEWLTKHLPRSLNSAKRIVAISRFTKEEIIKLLGISEKRLTVIHLGVNDACRPRENAELKEKLKVFDIEPKKYILSVGTLEPRKNIQSLLKAYELLPGAVQSNWPLVIAGMRGWKDHTITKGIEALTRRGNVKFLGFVPEKDLPFIYAGAGLFVFPSLYEGFGLPALEAMASGVPVVVSNRASLPEVVGDAGIYIDPENIESMVHAIKSLLEDPEKCKQMAKMGLLQAKQFTWEACAQKTFSVYQEVLGKDR